MGDIAIHGTVVGGEHDGMELDGDIAFETDIDELELIAEEYDLDGDSPYESWGF
jgi:hypothetical protein